MRPGNSIHEKEYKSRRASPAARFALIVILVLAVGFLIFYIIDNPGFLGDFKSRFLDSPGDGEPEEETGSVLIVEEEAVIQEDPKEEIVHEVQETGPSSEGISLWQKALGFFSSKFSEEAPVESYSGRIQINIYFISLGDDEKLAPEERSIVAGDPRTAAQNAVLELLKGPTMSYHFPVIPAGTRLLGVEVYENLAEIDFSQEFLENSLDSRILDEYIIYSIVNTITGVPEISGVIFFIEGKRIKLFGNIDLSIPAIRNTEYIDGQPVPEE